MIYIYFPREKNLFKFSIFENNFVCCGAEGNQFHFKTSPKFKEKQGFGEAESVNLAAAVLQLTNFPSLL